jgi:hypothetical protein
VNYSIDDIQYGTVWKNQKTKELILVTGAFINKPNRGNKKTIIYVNKVSKEGFKYGCMGASSYSITLGNFLETYVLYFKNHYKIMTLMKILAKLKSSL